METNEAPAVRAETLTRPILRRADAEGLDLGAFLDVERRKVDGVRRELLLDRRRLTRRQ